MKSVCTANNRVKMGADENWWYREIISGTAKRDVSTWRSVESIRTDACPPAGCRRRSRRSLGRSARVARCRRLNDPVADGHDPVMLQQFHGSSSLLGVAVKAALEEVNAFWAELIWRRELWGIALGDVVHDRPLVV